MKPKLTEIEKLKYWIDTEFTILHIMFAIIMWQLTEGWIPHILLSVYIVFSVLYMLVRSAYLAVSDKDYPKVPRNDA